MKKIYLTSALFFAAILIGKAQYTQLVDFGLTNDSQPFGAVILSADDSTLYGMTNGGDSAGCVFSVRTDGTSYQNLHAFSTTATSGAWPYGSLIRSGTVLYGMTSGYGLYGKGTIFSIAVDGSNYTKLFDFPYVPSTDSATSGMDIGGGNPNGTLLINGNILYGTTYGTGGPNNGNVFSIHTDGSNYTDLHSFTGPDGSRPGYGALVLSGSKLFGTTMYGGTSGLGVLFSLDTNGTGYTKLIDFNTANGAMPYGSVAISGNVLYGNTIAGGISDKGTLFSIHTDGSNYIKLLDFTGVNGQSPIGSLTIDGSMLYGTTQSGGANSTGTVFSIDTSGSGFQILYDDFSVASGIGVRSTLSHSGSTFYGTTVSGGSYDLGTVFSLKPVAEAIPICMVTVDDASDYNHVYWETPASTAIDSFIIYRETTSNTYMPIGAVAYGDGSEFVDTVRTKYFPFTGDPNVSSNRYKIQVKDTSGFSNELSPYHNTILVTQSGGVFNWNFYEIEGQSVPSLSSYILYRDDYNTGVWNPVAGVSGTQNTIIDPNYVSYPNGRWRIKTGWGLSCSPNASFSNKKAAVVAGVMEKLLPEEISIYPNPANDFIDVQTHTETVTVSVFSNTGAVVFEKVIGSQVRIDLSSFSKGIYLIKIRNEESSFTKKIIKE